jgi:C4-dicarboxylate-specific signal transduction histidine kinase
MKRDPDPIGDAGLQFFGRMSASISHELKNALAIIKENAGLLADYVAMMGKGTPIDP